MQIVINIPDEAYRKLITGEYDYGDMNIIIKNGTPLPKGHGGLVDYEELKNNAREYGAYAEAILSHIKPTTIIEADADIESEVQNADSN